MGQRNEKSLKEKLEEARRKKELYSNEAMHETYPDRKKLYEMKATKARHFIEFARWMLGQDKELEL